MTAKEFAEKILALPEEQQNAVMAFSYYDDSESSIPVYEVIEEFYFYKRGYPLDKPHILVSG